MNKKAVLIISQQENKKTFSAYSVLNHLKLNGFWCEIWFVDVKIMPRLFKADRIVCINRNEDYVSENTLDTLTSLCKEVSPDICLFCNSIYANELCTRLSFRFNGSALNNITDLKYHEKKLIIKRRIYGENVEAMYSIEAFPFFSTVKVKEFCEFSVTELYEKEIVQYDECTDFKSFRLSKAQLSTNELKTAKVVFSVGNGFSGKDQIAALCKIEALDGIKIGATRKVTQNGWMPSSKLIGTTGLSITADLLIVMGASGSGPFMAGAKYAKHIIAVNTDKNSPIFSYAHQGITADCNEVSKHIISLLKDKTDDKLQ